MKGLISVILFSVFVTGCFTHWGSQDSKCDCCPQPCCCICVETGSIPETVTLPPTTVATTTEFIPECNSTLCLGFILDRSGSIEDPNWILVKNFVYHVMNQMVGRGTRTACVVYETNALTLWGYNDLAGSSQAEAEAILGPTPLGQFTNIVEGMEFMINDVLNKSDPDCPKVFLVISDGRSTTRLDELEGMSLTLQSYGPVEVIGVTDQINMTELEIVSSRDHIFELDDFEDLEGILAEIIKTVCTEPPPTRPPVVPRPRPTLPPLITEECFCCCPPPPPPPPQHHHHGYPPRYPPTMYGRYW